MASFLSIFQGIAAGRAPLEMACWVNIHLSNQAVKLKKVMVSMTW
jgi:hypothetical protein